MDKVCVFNSVDKIHTLFRHSVSDSHQKRIITLCVGQCPRGIWYFVFVRLIDQSVGQCHRGIWYFVLVRLIDQSVCRIVNISKIVSDHEAKY